IKALSNRTGDNNEAISKLRASLNSDLSKNRKDIRYYERKISEVERQINNRQPTWTYEEFDQHANERRADYEAVTRSIIVAQEVPISKTIRSLAKLSAKDLEAWGKECETRCKDLHALLEKAKGELSELKELYKLKDIQKKCQEMSQSPSQEE